MTEINITLPDDSVKTMPTGTTSQQVADSIGSGLARAVVVARIDGNLTDLNSPLEQDCSLELFTGDTPEGHDTLLHSTAHLMAQAVKELFPETKVTIDPINSKQISNTFLSLGSNIKSIELQMGHEFPKLSRDLINEWMASK